MTSDVVGQGTAADPWVLKTQPGTSDYAMHKDEASDPPRLVCTVGKTTLYYQPRCLQDLHAMLRAHGAWNGAGVGRRAETDQGGHGRGLGSIREQSGRRLVRPEEGAPRPVRDVHP